MIEILLVFLGALSRLVPHLPNFTAVSAVALYGAAKLDDRKQAVWIPVLAMLISDSVMELMYRAGLSPIQGFHGGMGYVYAAFIVISFIGMWIRSAFSYGRLALGTLSASLTFFIITNFGVWLGGWYGYTLEGLTACYIAAIPFFRNQLAGDVFFVALLFGADALLRAFVAKKQTA